MKIITAVKGMQDMLPGDAEKWKFVETICKNNAQLHGFSEIRTPVVESTELFLRGVGETTDVVQKEMYTFEDRGARSITLRPEMTAGAVRAAIEHGLIRDSLPVKVFYIASCYRAEKPQAGRLREFHQFGVEMFGTSAPQADADVISIAREVIDDLGIDNVSLELNSIGCKECRSEYHVKLREYFRANEDRLCETCKSRLERNPMRILDCKSPVCQGICEHAPLMIDSICPDCREHFEGVKSCLDAMDIEYSINPKIVRGLDYYTRTVFEFVSKDIGAQSTVCGGGRYDGLFEEVGGPKMPSLGFAMGLERILLTMEAQGIEFPPHDPPLLYLAPVGKAATALCAKIAREIRMSGVTAEYDMVGRSVKAQMKYADKIGVLYTVVIGDDEIAAGTAKLKNMEDGEAEEIQIDAIADRVCEIGIGGSFGRLTELLEGFSAMGNLAEIAGAEENPLDLTGLLDFEDKE
ncbi:MAG: histidine--tRNA ligase [Oscillospiraceae bacterium]|nr:histidine--tRNA ligase [Oscillospiraceae bacterium]